MVADTRTKTAADFFANFVCIFEPPLYKTYRKGCRLTRFILLIHQKHCFFRWVLAPGKAGRQIEISRNPNLLVADSDPHPAVQHPKHDSVLMIDTETSVVSSPHLRNVLAANPSQILAAPQWGSDSRWIVMIVHLDVVVRQSVRILIKREPYGKAHRRSSGYKSCAVSPACSRNLRILSLSQPRSPRAASRHRTDRSSSRRS